MQHSFRLGVISRFKALCALIVTLICFSSVQALAQGGERITDYRINVTVKTDRKVEVTETITVNALGNVIKRGIFRTIPTTYRNDDGTLLDIDLDVLSLKRDGNREPYARTQEGRFTQLRIGDANVFLKPGLHTYEIRYQVDQSIGFFEDYDEIYWNAIGTGWDFWIDKAEVTVNLPQGASIGRQYSVYTGAQGTRGDSYEVINRRENTLSVRTTRALAPGEGMTVAVGWQKGIVEPPSEAELAVKSALDNSPVIILALFTCLQFAWLFVSWSRVGKDPQGGAIIPRYRAPKHLSPAIASYVSGMGSFEKSMQTSFMAALINLAIKRFVTIDNTGDDLTIRKRDKVKQKELDTLPVGERALYAALMPSGKETVFADMKYAKMTSITSAFAQAVDTETDQVYFRRNSGYMVPGFLLAIAGAAGFLFASLAFAPPYNFPLLEILGAVLVFGAVLVIRSLWGLVTGKSSALFGKVMIVPTVIVSFFVGILITEEEAILDLAGSTVFLIPAILLLAGMLLALTFFSEWMKAPTKLGRELLDEIEGLKLFMTVTASEQVTAARDAEMPELTPRLYEDLLPYAIALGIEKKWSSLFEEKVFSQLPPDQAYQPYWYRGDFNPYHPAAAMSAMTNTLNSDLSSAMTPPASSSSGSSGGGFSGGGGGGGGGGGW